MLLIQRGAASLEVALGVSFSIGAILFILTLLHPLSTQQDAQAINQQLNAITDGAALSYKKAVMLSRCLSQTGTMNLQRLINEQRVPSDINQGLWRFEVKLIDLPIGAWTRPSRIETTVTFNTIAERQAVIARLPPSKTDHLTLTFTTPLRIDISDNWSHFNKQTGCYE